MELTTFNFWGKTKYWWGIMLVGILLIPAGLWLLFQPVMGYAVISMLLGWGLILFMLRCCLKRSSVSSIVCLPD